MASVRNERRNWGEGSFMNILFLTTKNYYEKKMSRVRFHGMREIAKLCNFKMSGIGFPDWNQNKDFNKNVESLDFNPDLIVAYPAYAPEPENHFSGIEKSQWPLCIRYNEMYDIAGTKNEIEKCNANLVICHHENEMQMYPGMNFQQGRVEFVHIPHSADSNIFYPEPSANVKYDLMLGGMVQGHYPLRTFLKKNMPAIGKGLRWKILDHPGYNRPGASEDVFAREFADNIRSTKIFLTCSGIPKTRYAKYVEIPACGVSIAGDMPREDEENISKFLINIDPSMGVDGIRERLMYYLDNEADRQVLIRNGIDWASKYTQEKYAEKFISAAREFLAK